MFLSKWFPIPLILLLQVAFAKQQPPFTTAVDLSFDDALAVLVKEELYDLCAAYIKRPVYATRRIKTVTLTVSKTKTIIRPAATTKTISSGKARTTVNATIVDTASSAFGTDTQYSFFFLTQTSHTRITVPTTTIYTQTTHANARRALSSTFPFPLPYFTAILSSACSSLLASHISHKTSTKLSTTTKTRTTTATRTHRTIVPRTTVTGTLTIASTTTVPYLALATTSTTFTIITTLTRTRYLSTTHIPAQCAPTAYVMNADEYTDGADENFTRAPEQPDALSCCKLCISTPNCQAWVWSGDPLQSPPGACVFLTGESEDRCPAPDFNRGFYPICSLGSENKFSAGLGACASEIDLANDRCALGQNQ